MRALRYLTSFLNPSSSNWKTNIKTVSFCHVSDVVRSCRQALSAPVEPGEVFVISHPEVHTWDTIRDLLFDLIHQLASRDVITGRQKRMMVQQVSRLAITVPDIPTFQYWGCDPSLAGEKLDFSASRALAEGALETVGWYFEHGFLPPVAAEQQADMNRRLI
jgi:nucleoside-diphosphate-sugar epimerase